MEVAQARIASFKKSKRVKNPTKTSATTTLKWPHPPDFKANPESLADAGFYYDPSYDDPDNVTCYICEKELSGWEEDDDPFSIHWVKCGQTCCWASVRCGLRSDMDQSASFVFSDKTRHPNHKSMEKARHETFSAGKGWIHDKTKNHGASSKMMARAGFVYTPQHSGDDLATCLYCNTSLSGWDADDDPMEEHRRREGKSGFSCPFFASQSEVTQSRKPSSRAQTVKPPSKSQSKPASRSTSKSKHQDIVLPTKMFDGELEDESDAAQSSNTTQTTAKTPRKGRSTSASSTRKPSAKTPRSKTRSSSRSGLKNVTEEDEEDEEDARVEPPPTVKKKARSRSKSLARAEATDHTDAEDEIEQTRKPSRSKSKAKAVPEPQEEEEVPRKSSRSKSKASVVPSVAPSVDEDEPPRKPSRTRSKPKLVESEPEQEAAPQVAAKPKAKHTRSVSRSKSKAPPEVPEVDSEPEPVVVVASKKKAPTKSKPQIPEAKDLFNEDIVLDNYIPPPSSPPASMSTSTPELPPLFIPKRTAAKKAPTPLGDSEEPQPVENERRKPGRPKAKPKPAARAPPSEEDFEAPEPSIPSDVYGPLIPVSINPSTHPPAKEKLAAKSKPPSQRTDVPAKQKMQVVEVSSDEEPEEVEPEKAKKKQITVQGGKENSHDSVKAHTLAPPTAQGSSEAQIKPIFANGKRERREVAVEPAQIAKPTRPPSPEPIPPMEVVDVHMDIAEPDTDIGMYTAPSTPPRPTVQKPLSNSTENERPVTPSPSLKELPVSASAEPPFIPALSKLPFTPLQALSDAELDMTVEEWIRYQMEVEFDKFRRDGERELLRFRRRAEEVRKVIEGL